MAAIEAPRIEVGRGFARGESSFHVGAEATAAAIGAIQRHALTVLIVYASVRYDLDELLGGVRSVVGESVPLLGTTTAGEICDGLCEGSVVVMALASPHLTVHCSVGERVGACWQRARRGRGSAHRTALLRARCQVLERAHPNGSERFRRRVFAGQHPHERDAQLRDP
jgi:hypothetical protein